MLSQNNNQRIDAFLSGDVPPEDRRAFERKIATDPELAGEVTLWQNVDAALRNDPTLSFQQQVTTAGKEYLAETEKAPAKIRRLGVTRRLLSIAAALLLLIASSVLAWQFSQGDEAPNGQALFAANFTPYQLTPPTVRGSVADAQSELERGILLYQQGDFASAATTLAALPPTYQDSMDMVFPLANAYLNQQPPQTSLAEAQFKKVIDHGDNAHVHEAQWYLALINLQRENFPEAKTLLEAAGRVNDATGKQARALLAEL